MWKSRDSKKYKVYEFTDKFTSDILSWACENKGIVSIDQIENTNMSNELSKFAKNKKYSRFRREMLTLSQCKEIAKVLFLFNLYKRKYARIIQGFTRVPVRLNEQTLSELKGAFEYYYEELLDNQLFWEVYNPNEQFKTKQQVRKDISKNKVCPYCDQTYITGTKKTNMDHFLPISSFPFIGIHWKNLIVSCSICNGVLCKNSKWFLPILHPYFDDIERIIFFTFDKKQRKIGISNYKKVKGITRSNERAKNLLELFDFEEMYNGTWCEVDNEDKLINTTIMGEYHRHKGTLNQRNIGRLVDNSIEMRRIELKEKAGKMSFAKLKYDYSNVYKENMDIKMLEWFLNEQKGL